MCLGIPGKVVDIWEDAGTRMSTVDFGGTSKTVCLAYLPDMQIGEYTIVHAGFAITRLDEESARQTLQMFEDLGVLDEELAGSEGQAASPEAAAEAAPGRRETA
ncbi:HypC/HybG/HupF family hydrogenase formation chaperone [Mycolicibacterium palauense]|uniref:HypC/HybG/HupF family hydrogenase formation chaperone n=1 Tax=Mycolicibacterium palauense TaxID=2034511 RepID=UPI000BFEF872|nr:HypC/HybG/HupF family hydrogenase formation chaperone [Mycolicibacterium palauense]